MKAGLSRETAPVLSCGARPADRRQNESASRGTAAPIPVQIPRRFRKSNIIIPVQSSCYCTGIIGRTSTVNWCFASRRCRNVTPLSRLRHIGATQEPWGKPHGYKIPPLSRLKCKGTIGKHGWKPMPHWYSENRRSPKRSSTFFLSLSLAYAVSMDRVGCECDYE